MTRPESGARGEGRSLKQTNKQTNKQTTRKTGYVWNTALGCGAGISDMAATKLPLLLGTLATAYGAAPPPPRVVLIVLGDDIGYASAGWAAGSPAATAGRSGADAARTARCVCACGTDAMCSAGIRRSGCAG